MGISKVNYGGETLIDLTADTVTAQTLAEGETAHDAAGNQVIGSCKVYGNNRLFEHSIPVDGWVEQSAGVYAYTVLDSTIKSNTDFTFRDREATAAAMAERSVIDAAVSFGQIVFTLTGDLPAGAIPVKGVLMDCDGQQTQGQIVLQDIFDMVYPVGTILHTYTNQSPAATVGGTWEQIAQGRTLIGAGTLDGNTYTAGAEGGAPECRLSLENLPYPTVILSRNDSALSAYIASVGLPYSEFPVGEYRAAAAGGIADIGTDPNVTETYKSMNIMQPYLVCYIWLRVNPEEVA